MNIYILVQTYSTGVSVNRDVFSSRKKAQAELDYILDTEQKHGWQVDRNWMLGQHPVGAMYHRIRKGVDSNTTLYHIERHGVI